MKLTVEGYKQSNEAMQEKIVAKNKQIEELELALDEAKKAAKPPLGELEVLSVANLSEICSDNDDDSDYFPNVPKETEEGIKSDESFTFDDNDDDDDDEESLPVSQQNLLFESTVHANSLLGSSPSLGNNDGNLLEVSTCATLTVSQPSDSTASQSSAAMTPILPSMNKRKALGGDRLKDDELFVFGQNTGTGVAVENRLVVRKPVARKGRRKQRQPVQLAIAAMEVVADENERAENQKKKARV